MRLLLILVVLVLAYIPKLVLWEALALGSANLLGPGNTLDTLEKVLVALASVIVSMFALLWLAARIRA